jgi:hypothetical protein
MKKVSLKLEYGVKTPWDKLDEWQQKANQYTATLKYKGRQMTVPFFTGQGWTKEPTWKDILGSLVSDYYCYESADSFEGFCQELGYDSDSRKAENTYKQIEKQSIKLERLLGDDLQEVCLYLQEQGY